MAGVDHKGFRADLKKPYNAAPGGPLYMLTVGTAYGNGPRGMLIKQSVSGSAKGPWTEKVDEHSDTEPATEPATEPMCSSHRPVDSDQCLIVASRDPESSVSPSIASEVISCTQAVCHTLLDQMPALSPGSGPRTRSRICPRKTTTLAAHPSILPRIFGLRSHTTRRCLLCALIAVFRPRPAPQTCESTRHTPHLQNSPLRRCRVPMQSLHCRHLARR